MNSTGKGKGRGKEEGTMCQRNLIVCLFIQFGFRESYAAYERFAVRSED